jgi:hypothetical protein
MATKTIKIESSITSEDKVAVEIAEGPLTKESDGSYTQEWVDIQQITKEIAELKEIAQTTKYMLLKMDEIDQNIINHSCTPVLTALINDYEDEYGDLS